MEKILVLSSEHTGHGHKSIAQALVNQFEAHKDEFEIKVVNSFELNGPLGRFLEKRYKFIVTYVRPLWNFIFYITGKHAKTLNKLTASTMEKRFIKLIEGEKPNLIVSVHAGYVGSVINLLEKRNINIPFYVILADLVDLSPLWADKRADVTICPTVESMDVMRNLGVPDEKMFLSGFPVRKAFYSPIKDEEELTNATLSKEDLSILIINASEKKKRMTYIADTLLKRYNCRMTIICGRDKLLYNQLTDYYKDKHGLVTVNGYTTNMQDYFNSHDIVVTRCGPNTMLEAVNCLIPIVSMGALPGQEQDNPVYMENNNLGLKTTDTDDIFDKIESLLKDGRKKLLDIRKSQFYYQGRNAAERITKFIIGKMKSA